MIAKLFKYMNFGLWIGLMIACTNEYEKADLCFVGDSITELWDIDYYFPAFSTIKISEGGAKIRDVYNWRFDACKGKKVVVLIGTNDVENMSIDDEDSDKMKKMIENQYVELLKKIPYESVVVVSLLPRNLHYKQKKGVNAFINDLNNGLKKRVTSNDIVNGSYADVFQYFLDENCAIKRDLFNDGLHPSPSGYEVLSNEIMKFL